MIAAVVLMNIPVQVSAPNITMNISGLQSAKGQVIIQVFKDHQSFVAEQPYKIFRYSKKVVKNGALTAHCDLQPGATYGRALLDDENGNGVMDYNFLKIPKEGFGFSDY